MVMHLGEAQNNSFFIKFNFVLVYITKSQCTSTLYVY